MFEGKFMNQIFIELTLLNYFSCKNTIALKIYKYKLNNINKNK